MVTIRKMNDGVVVSVKVQPNSSRNKVVGEYADQIKIAVTSPPENGKANKSVIEVLADRLGTKKSDIRIITGAKSRDKEVFIKDITEEDVYRLINLLRK